MRYQYILNVILIFPVITQCSRYDYLLFENYEVMKKSFLIELNNVRNLQSARNDLHTQLSELKSTIRNSSKANNGILPHIESRRYIASNYQMNPSNKLICQDENSCSLKDSYNRYQLIDTRNQFRAEWVYDIYKRNVLNCGGEWYSLSSTLCQRYYFKNGNVTSDNFFDLYSLSAARQNFGMKLINGK